ncbi:MAG: 50S ribosomal protein L11 [Candidatus Hodarchaeales archaeon]|jgi:large subunit ribosomal protein L11
MSKPTEIKAIVDGGKASAGPPLGPALGPLRLNVKAVIDDINEKTIDFKGMKVPIVVKVNTETRKYEIEVKTPQTSVLLIKEAGAEKGSGTAGTEFVGDISFEAVIKVAKMKNDVMLGIGLKNATKETLGTAISCGITVEGKSPKEVITDVIDGKYDSHFK